MVCFRAVLARISGIAWNDSISRNPVENIMQEMLLTAVVLVGHVVERLVIFSCACRSNVSGERGL